MVSGENTEEQLVETGQPIDLASGDNVEHLARLIFLSYRYSQGGIGTQNRMLLHIEAHHQPLLFDPSCADAVLHLAHQKIGRFFLNEASHPATAIPWDHEAPDEFFKTSTLVTNEINGLFERFQDRAQIQYFDPDIAGIAASIITMDYDYMNRPGGRAGSDEDLMVRVGPYARDPYNSLFLHHGVLGVGTGTVEFDSIFEQASSEVVLEGLDWVTKCQLGSVIDIYFREHPGLDEYAIGSLNNARSFL